MIHEGINQFTDWNTKTLDETYYMTLTSQEALAVKMKLDFNKKIEKEKKTKEFLNTKSIYSVNKDWKLR